MKRLLDQIETLVESRQPVRIDFDEFKDDLQMYLDDLQDPEGDLASWSEPGEFEPMTDAEVRQRKNEIMRAAGKVTKRALKIVKGIVSKIDGWDKDVVIRPVEEHFPSAQIGIEVVVDGEATEIDSGADRAQFVRALGESRGNEHPHVRAL